MTPPAGTRGTRVELYGRETLPAPVRSRRDRVEARLAALVDEGAVDAVAARDWPKRIPCDGAADPADRDRYLAFREWAAASDVRLAPFFQTRECYSMETGERGDWMVFPALCLAVYEDDELEAVYPHADGDAYRSVLAGVASLEESRDDRSDEPERVVPGHAD